MNNITYNIKEYSIEELLSDNNLENEKWEEIILSNKMINEDIFYNDMQERLAKSIDYDLNYNLNYINNILEFYNLNKITNKKSKKEKIEFILDFEMDINNKDFVTYRKRLFQNFIELKQNKFFNKFIIVKLN